MKRQKIDYRVEEQVVFTLVLDNAKTNAKNTKRKKRRSTLLFPWHKLGFTSGLIRLVRTIPKAGLLCYFKLDTFVARSCYVKTAWIG